MSLPKFQSMFLSTVFFCLLFLGFFFSFFFPSSFFALHLDFHWFSFSYFSEPPPSPSSRPFSENTIKTGSPGIALKLLHSKEHFCSLVLILSSVEVLCVFFSCVRVLWFPSTTYKHTRRWNGYGKLPLSVNKCVCAKCLVMNWHPIQDVFPPHSQYSQDRTRIHPEQEKAITEAKLVWV